MPAAFDGDAVPCLWEQQRLRNLQQTVQTAPDDVGQAASVPEPAHQKCDHQIQAVTPFRHPVAAERDIDIVSEPCGERNVPAAPELLDRKGEVGAFEIGHQIDPEQLGTADGNIRVA